MFDECDDRRAWYLCIEQRYQLAGRATVRRLRENEGRILGVRTKRDLHLVRGFDHLHIMAIGQGRLAHRHRDLDV